MVPTSRQVSFAGPAVLTCEQCARVSSVPTQSPQSPLPRAKRSAALGRAVAEKIREVEGSRDLKQVAEDVLPQIEKFLESPEEKRLRRMRAGVITAASGAGACVTGLVLAAIIYGDVGKALTMGGAGLGFLIFLVGLGLVLNGVWFTGLRKGVEDHSLDADLQNQLDAGYAPSQLISGSATPPTFRSPTTSNLSKASGSSVTEHTTLHLKNDR